MLTKKIQQAGFSFDEYVNAVQNYRSLVRQLVQEAHPEETHAERLKMAAAKGGVTCATLMTEDWCGDSACNLPVLGKLFAAAAIPFVIVRGSELPELKAFYESSGDDHIPAVSLWRGDESEIVRWIEAPKAVTARKDAWKAAHPEFMELFRKQNAGDSDAAKRFGKLYRVFLETMASWYREGMWSETTREIVERTERGLT